MTLSIFSCVCWQSVYLFWRNVYLGLLPIFGLGFFLILSCRSCLCILEINPLSVASFANIFSHSEGCLFVLFMDSFAVQKLLSFIRSHLLGVFLITNSISLLVTGLLRLFLPDSVLEKCTFLEIYSFFSRFPICWHITVHNILLWGFCISVISVVISSLSFLILFIWVLFFS